MHDLLVGGGWHYKVPEDQLSFSSSPLKYEPNLQGTGGESIPKEQFLKRSGCNNMKAQASE